jgi:hypothetical protein
LAPVGLAEEVQPFDVIQARCDGVQFWFDQLEPRHDPATAAWLRSSLDAMTPPEELRRPGLTLEQRAAYELRYWQAQKPEARTQADLAGEPHVPLRDVMRERLRASLSHAGAELIDYLERSDGLMVSYAIDGQRYTSSVDKDNLTVHSAGICLSGRDSDFDLTSLVGVMREAH